MSRVSKPNCISVIPVPFRTGGKNHVSYGLTVGFDLLRPNVLMAEVDVWQSIHDQLGRIGTIDSGFAKGQGEWLLAGQAFAPSGVASPAWSAQVSIGAVRKQLKVHGPREWNEQGLTQAIPCNAVTMDWGSSYGGDDFSDNLQGCGRSLAKKTIVVPCIESPDHPWRGPDESCKAANTLPLQTHHPLRQQYMGTYDAQYLQAYYPGMPPDFDRRHFNLSSLDQRIDGFWVGDEAYELTHWHPQHERICACLPGLRPALWVGQKDGALTKVPMSLTTVWFFPESLLGVLVFHGLHPVASLDGHEIEKVLAGMELIGEAMSGQAHYEAIWQQRTQRTVQAAAAALDDSVLIPDGYQTRFTAVDTAFAQHKTPPHLLRLGDTLSKRWQQAADSVDAQLASLDEINVQQSEETLRDISKHFRHLGEQSLKLTASPTSLSELGAYMKDTDASIDAIKHKAKTAFVESQQKFAAPNAHEAGITTSSMTALTPLPPAEPVIESLHKMLAQWPSTGPAAQNLKPEDAAAHIDKLSQLFAAMGKTPEEWRDQTKQLSQAYSFVFKAGTPTVTPNTDVMSLGEEFMGSGKIPQFQILDDLDLKAGIGDWQPSQSISNQSYAQMDFKNRDMTGLVLENVTLVACDLRACILNHAKCISCKFIGCDFQDVQALGIGFEKCQFQWCRIDSMHLADSKWQMTQLMYCLASNADFGGSDWKFSTWLEGKCENSIWRGAHFLHCIAHSNSYGQADFSQVIANKSSWSSCRLEMSQWQQTTLERCNMGMSQLPLLWQKAKLSQVSFHGAQMENGQWNDACLDSVDLGDCVLRHCNFSGIRANNLQLQHADLTGSNFTSANIENGLFMHADLRMCDFSKAKLSHCWLGQSLQDDSTQLQGADLRTSTLVPQSEVVAA